MKKNLLIFIIVFSQITIKAQSVDYPSAIPQWVPSCNTGGSRSTSVIDTWVNHWIGVGTYAGSISWFLTCPGPGTGQRGYISGTNTLYGASSAHFILNTNGEITQLVPVNIIAYHAGATGYNNNPRSIGVEHAVTVSDPSKWNSSSMLQASTNLAIYFCDLYSIPKVRALPGIRGHNEMPGTNTECPGPFPWTTWMNMLNGGGGTPPDNDDCSDAESTTSNGSCKNGTVEGATTSYGSNACEGCGGCPKSPDDNDVYYKFVAKATSHAITVTTESNDFDVVIELRTDCGYNTAISCYDPSGKPSTVSHTWDNLTIGKTYYIRVYEYNNSGTPPSLPEFAICVTHEENATANITGFSFPSTVDAGSTFEINYCTIEASANMSVLLGASLLRNGIYYSDPSNDIEIPLYSNMTNVKSRKFDLSRTEPTPSTGVYDIIVALWRDNNGNGEIDGGDEQISSKTYSQALTINASCIKPGTPASANGTSTGQTTANLSWSAGNPVGSSTVTYYWVVGTNPSVTYGNGVAQNTTTGTTASVTGLSAGTTYYLRVYAKSSCDGSESAYITSSSFTTDASTPTLNPARNLTVSAGDGKVTLNWSAPSSGSPNSYRVFCSTSENGIYVAVTSNITYTNETIFELTNGTKYWFYVVAYYSEGSSDPSNIVSATPSGSSCIPPGNVSSLSNKTVTAPDGTNFSVTASGSHNIYTWQMSTGFTWYPVPNSPPYSGVNTETLTISSTTTSMNGYQYRCIVTSSCDQSAAVNSNGATLSVTDDCTAPTSPTSATASQTTITSGQSTTLQVNGGALNSAPNWVWYTGNCGGTQVGTGNTLPVSPTSTTTYYVQASACGTTTTCRSVTITVTQDCVAPSAPATFTFSIGDAANGLEHHLDATVSEVLGVDGYSWDYSWDGITWDINYVQDNNTYKNWNINDYPNQPIYWRIRAYNCLEKLYSSYTYASPQPIYTACDDPAIPTVNGATSNSLNITLNAETPIENPAYTNYSIYCTTMGKYVQSNGTLGNSEVFKTKAEWGTKTVTGLSENTEYCFYVKAKNGDGDVRYNPYNFACVMTDTEPVCNLSLSPATLSFSESTGNKTVNVTSNSNWTVTDDSSWITVSPTSGSNNGTVTVSVSTNNTGAERNGTVSVTGCDTTETVTVLQAGPCNLSLSKSSLNFTSSSGSNTVNVTSNSNWTVSDNTSWITITPTTGNNNGTVTVSTSTNNTGAQRNGTVTVTGCNTTKTITITQETNCTPPVSPTSIIASKATIDAGQSVALQVNGGALNDAPNWIWYEGSCGGKLVGTGSSLTVSPTSTTTYYLQASACDYSTTCRSIKITVNKSCTLVFSRDSLNVPSSLGSFSLTVFSNASWTVSDKSDWISFSHSSGIGNRTGTITVNENPGDLRTGYITLTGCDSVITLFVKQEGITTGIDDEQFWGQIKIYPNPTKGIITIEGLLENKSTEIAIYDINRRFIKNQTSTSSFTKVDISDVVSGTYLIVINNQFQQSYKIIKK